MMMVVEWWSSVSIDIPVGSGSYPGLEFKEGMKQKSWEEPEGAQAAGSTSLLEADQQIGSIIL